MKKIRIYYMAFFIFFLITNLMSTIYRAYIYDFYINDYGIADIFPNIGAVTTASFLFIAKADCAEYKDELKIISLSTLGFIIYEFIQIKLPISTFDWKDIIGTIIGGFMTFIIHKFLIITCKLNYYINEKDTKGLNK